MSLFRGPDGFRTLGRSIPGFAFGSGFHCVRSICRLPLKIPRNWWASTRDIGNVTDTILVVVPAGSVRAGWEQAILGFGGKGSLSQGWPPKDIYRKKEEPQNNAWTPEAQEKVHYIDEGAVESKDLNAAHETGHDSDLFGADHHTYPLIEDGWDAGSHLKALGDSSETAFGRSNLMIGGGEMEERKTGVGRRWIAAKEEYEVLLKKWTS